MIMKKILSLASCALLLAAVSCDNYLDVTSESQTTLDSFFNNESECRASTSPLYNKVWFDFNNTFYFGFMDGRANNVFAPWSDYIYPYVNLTENTSTANLYAAWQSFFVIISQSDYALNNLGRAIEKGVNEDVVNECKAECRFMRGTAYWYLSQTWGNVPIIEDPQTLINDPICNTNPIEDVLAFAIRDLEYAQDYLPEKGYNEGRVTTYSASGMLARLYNTAAAFVRGGKVKTGSLSLSADEYYELAREAALRVAEESDYALMENYEDLFKVQNNNNCESLFSLQWVPNSDYGTTNFADSYLAHGSTVVGGRSAWGNATYGSGDLIELFVNRGERIRLAATYFTNNCYYDYIRMDLGGYTVGVTGDSNDGKAWIKKGVVGSSDDTGGLATTGNSALCTPMLRLADVLLHYVEACIGEGTQTDDEDALSFFNEIRARAGLDPVAVITTEDLWNERRCELAMEGIAWTDFVRRAYYDETWVLTYMSKQNRNQGYSYDWETNVFEWSEDKVGSKDEEVPTASRLLLPYPETELIKNQLLKADPVPYVFNE